LVKRWMVKKHSKHRRNKKTSIRALLFFSIATLALILANLDFFPTLIIALALFVGFIIYAIKSRQIAEVGAVGAGEIIAVVVEALVFW
jgi:hypothetical protein